MFNALVLDRTGDEVTASIQELEDERLPAGDVVVTVQYSSLNYKDALAVTGRGKIIRGDYPFVPGIDLVGTVEETSSERFSVGDRVIGTGWGLGETHWGGYSERQRVRSDGLVRLPEGLTALDAMKVGTAGFTAMLSVVELEAHGVHPGQGEVVVTGASGGVGSMAVAILSHLGYEVVASTGTASAHDYLRALGAVRIVDRHTFSGGPSRPLESARWAGAVDVVGGDTLAAVLASVGRRGCVAACGNAGGHVLHTTVFPFILRGVRLVGIDSNTSPHEEREAVWRRVVDDLPAPALERIQADVVPLEQVPEWSEALLEGAVRGRLVVDVGASGSP